jgi:uncharacterized protein (UPF0218 family)
LESGFARAASHASWYAMNVFPAPPLLFAKHIPLRVSIIDHRPKRRPKKKRKRERQYYKSANNFQAFPLLRSIQSNEIKSSIKSGEDKNDDFTKTRRDKKEQQQQRRNLLCVGDIFVFKNDFLLRSSSSSSSYARV